MAALPPPPVAEIAADARWLVQACDPAAGLARLVAMTPEAYRSASFLDDRMLQPGLDARLVPVGYLVEASGAVPREDARWIFHIGHVGSTLVGRLLGELGRVLSVREPRALRDLVLAGDQAGPELLPAMRRLMSRTFADDQVALVKATSFVSDRAADLTGASGKALFLTVSPRSYIETILAGENSRRELRAMLPFRLQRIAGRIAGLTVTPQDHDARLAAFAWACEMTALEQSATRLGSGQVLWADFDRLLADMGEGLERIAGFMDLPAAPGQLDAIAAGPLMRRYSKALEHDYSPDLRRRLLKQAAAANRTDIDSALHWLDSAAATLPLLRAAADRATS